MMAIGIPRKDNHPNVGDNLTRYYHLPFIRHFFLKRLVLALSFLNGRHFDSILEIGFGSGVLLPELSTRSTRLFGVDIHEHIGDVNKMLRIEGIDTMLTKGDIVHLPYKSESFDCIISIGTLEHIKQLREAVFEIKRILKKDGFVVLGFPVANRLSDLLLVLTGSLRAYKKKLREIHPNNHSDILSEVKAQFGNVKIKRFPGFLPLDFSLYCSCLAKKVS